MTMLEWTVRKAVGSHHRHMRHRVINCDKARSGGITATLATL